jgi:hypothetical protein
MATLTEGVKLTIRPTYIVKSYIRLRKEYESFRCNRMSLGNLNKEKNRGVMSEKQRTRLKNAANWLIYSSKKKELRIKGQREIVKYNVGFITLTIPEQEKGAVSNKVFISLINTFLTYHRRYSKLVSYVWKFEEHKDGRLHVHMLVGQFINHKVIRESWNKILLRNGLLAYHYKKYENYSPPSTEIKAVKKVSKLGAYIAKYMSKSKEMKSIFRGRIWGCSYEISRALNLSINLYDDDFSTEMRALYSSKIKMKEIMSAATPLKEAYQVGELFMLEVKDWVEMKACKIKEAFINTLRAINSSYQLKAF